MFIPSRDESLVLPCKVIVKSYRNEIKKLGFCPTDTGNKKVMLYHAVLESKKHNSVEQR